MKIETVEFLYCLECPSHEIALQRLRESIAESGLPLNIAPHLVRTNAEAAVMKFRGSPTFRIGGSDLFPEQERELLVDQPFALSCRAYLTDANRISPLPTKAMLVRALRRVFSEQGT